MTLDQSFWQSGRTRLNPDKTEVILAEKAMIFEGLDRLALDRMELAFAEQEPRGFSYTSHAV